MNEFIKPLFEINSTNLLEIISIGVFIETDFIFGANGSPDNKVYLIYLQLCSSIQLVKDSYWHANTHFPPNSAYGLAPPAALASSILQLLTDIA